MAGLLLPGFAVATGFALLLALGVHFDASLFAWHPLAMVLAIGVALPAAVWAVRARHATHDANQRTTLVKLHGSLQFLACASLAVGMGSIYLNKEEYGRQHLTSWHAWVGAAAGGMMVMGWLAGAAKTCLRSKPLYTWTDPMHRASGKAALILATVALILGLRTNYGQSVLEGNAGYAFIGLAAIAALLTAFTPAVRVAASEKPAAAKKQN